MSDITKAAQSRKLEQIQNSAHNQKPPKTHETIDNAANSLL